MRALGLLRVLAAPERRGHAAPISAKDSAPNVRLGVERSERIEALKRRVADAWLRGRVGEAKLWALEANVATGRLARKADALSLVGWWNENVSRRPLSRQQAPSRVLRGSSGPRRPLATRRRVRTRVARVGGRPVARRVLNDGGGDDGDGPGDGPPHGARSVESLAQGGDA